MGFVMSKLKLKRLHFFILTALSTFAVGIAVAWLWLSFPKLSKVSDVPNSTVQEISSSVELPANLPEEIQITLEDSWLTQNEYVGQIAVGKFRVVNGLQEPLYYFGYSQNDHCAYQFKMKGKNVKQYPLCTCGTGLAERTLSSGETQIIQLNLPDKVKGEFEVEFEFAVGGERRKEKVRVKGITSY
ncbi:MAG TPA: hypothetical protein VNI84_21690 [Pyrinomonadaceae bacterium]|nr:hypothetical protein [Pyrinomonadaceae bacterium]